MSVFAGDVRPSPLLGRGRGLGVPAVAVVVSLRGAAARRGRTARRRPQSGRERPRGCGGGSSCRCSGSRCCSPTTADGRGRVPTLPLRSGSSRCSWASRRCCRGWSSARSRGSARVPWRGSWRCGGCSWIPAAPSRAVSGIAVAVAGAIALQMVSTAPRRGFQERTGADPDRAQLVLIRDAPHVRRALAAGSRRRRRAHGDGDHRVRRLGTTSARARRCGSWRGDPRLRRWRHVRDGRRGPRGATVVGEREDPGGAYRDGVFTTVAPAGRPGRALRVRARRPGRVRRRSATPPRSSTR